MFSKQHQHHHHQHHQHHHQLTVLLLVILRDAVMMMIVLTGGEICYCDQSCYECCVDIEQIVSFYWILIVWSMRI